MQLLNRISTAVTATLMAATLNAVLLPVALPGAAAPGRPQLRTQPRTTTVAPRPSGSRRRLNFRVGVRPSNYRIGGFARDNGCPLRKQVKALTPAAQASQAGNVSIDTTLSDRPTFFVYLPKMPATTLMFTLQNEAGTKQLHEATFDVEGQEGFVGVQLPASAQLKAGEKYRWQVAFPCEPDSPDFTKAVTISNLVQRVSAPGVPGTLEEQAAFFAEKGAWPDALSAVAQLRLQRPADPGIQQDWTDLMTSVGLGDLAKVPVLRVIAAQ